MQFTKPLLVSIATLMLAACQTTALQESEAADQAASAVEVQQATWEERKPLLLEALRKNSRLRVQEADATRIDIQIRSTDSFPVDGTSPSSQLLQVLDEIAQALEEQDNIAIEVVGHTDNQGGAQRNLELSSARAQAVADYLEAKGLSHSISSVGVGSEKPVASNATREGRAVNRRIDLHIQSTE